MEKLIDLISGQVSAAFEKAGYAPELGRVSVSARPDLCPASTQWVLSPPTGKLVSGR